MMKELFTIPITLFTVLIALCQDNVSQSLISPIQYSVTMEINYAGNKNMAQTLDVYIPKNKKRKKQNICISKRILHKSFFKCV